MGASARCRGGSVPAREGRLTDSPLPPCDLDSERLLVGAALLLGPRPGIEPKHFFYDSTRRVFEALLGNNAHPLEPCLVRAARILRRSKRLLQIGGTPELVRMIPDDLELLTEANLCVHADALVERWKQRVLSDAAAHLAAALRSEAMPAGEAWKRFKEICERTAA